MKLYELEKNHRGRILDKNIWKVLVRGTLDNVRFIDEDGLTYAVLDGGALGVYNNNEGWGIIHSDAPDEIEEKVKP